MAKKQELMLTKDEIQQAVDETPGVRKDYPAFWKFYEMLLEMNQELSYLQESMEKSKK